MYMQSQIIIIILLKYSNPTIKQYSFEENVFDNIENSLFLHHIDKKPLYDHFFLDEITVQYSKITTTKHPLLGLARSQKPEARRLATSPPPKQKKGGQQDS